MGRPVDAVSEPARALRAVALRLPEAQEGIACEGTAAERRTVTVRGKAFLILGAGDARLKLHDSLTEATDLAAREPERYEVGAHGWVKLTFAGPASPPVDVLTRWVEESYRLLAPRQHAAALPERASLSAGAAQRPKAEAGKKKPRSNTRPK